MGRLANGNTSDKIPARDRRDEIGAMAQSVRVFKDNMIETERLRTEQQAEQQRQIAGGQKIEASVAGFEKIIADVVNKVSSAAAAQVLASAGELSKNGEALKAQAENFLREVRAA